MPYESFNRCHHVHVCDIAQDAKTGTWRYVVQVERSMLDPSEHSSSSHSSHEVSPTMTSASPKLHRPEEMESFHCQVYTIERSYAAFKQLHHAMEKLIGADELPKLPDESLLSFFVGESQSLLEKRQYVVERILHVIETHSAASHSSAFLKFLANPDAFHQHSYVLPPRGIMMRNQSTQDFRTISNQVHHTRTRSSRCQESRPRLFSLDSNVDKCVELMRRTTLN